jgi:hypothetical protein
LHSKKAADFAIPFQELLHVLIDVTTSHRLLAIESFMSTRNARISNFFRVGIAEGIAFGWLWWSQFDALPGVPRSGVRVRIIDSDGSSIDTKMSSHYEIIGTEKASIRTRKAVSSNQRALRDSTVVLLLFSDVAGVIL